MVDDLLVAGHPASIDIVQAFIDGAHSDQELILVGAGPMEDLLSHNGHADAFVDEMERRARQQPRFRTAVRGLWLSQDVPAHVRDRLSRLGATDLSESTQGVHSRKPRRPRKN